MNSMRFGFGARQAAMIAGAALMLAASAQADILYTTGFSAPTYSDGGLIGQDGWLITGTSVVNPLTVSDTGTNGKVSLTTTGQDANRPFTPAVTSGSVFLTANVMLSAAQATGDYFLHLSDGGGSNFYSRIYARSSGAGFSLAMGTSSGTVGLVFGSELAFGTSYNLLARYDFVAGALNDTGALFVDPTDPFGLTDVAYVAATTTTGADATTISAVNLRQGTATSAPTLMIDNVTVSIIPTPASVSLLALGGLVATRRRRA